MGFLSYFSMRCNPCFDLRGCSLTQGRFVLWPGVFTVELTVTPPFDSL